jgi:hypothetical protein
MRIIPRRVGVEWSAPSYELGNGWRLRSELLFGDFCFLCVALLTVLRCIFPFLLRCVSIVRVALLFSFRSRSFVVISLRQIQIAIHQVAS